MFLPAVWIAAAFIAGVWLLAPLSATLGLWLSFCSLSLLFAFAALRRDFLRVALSAGLAAWLFIGALAGSLDSIALPPNHVNSLISAGKLDTTSPLRWQGRLRSDPVRLPTGIRYEIELEQVEVGGSVSSVGGGLRLNWYRNERDPDVPISLRAGDRVEALVRAHPPRNFMNPGAYDAKANLARQGVHLTGTLRSPELLEKRAGPPPRFSHRLARIRGNLLGKVDQMFATAPADAAFLRAMLLGDYSFIDHELADLFQRTSVYHILVISGAHLALLAAIVFWIGRRMHMPPWASMLATLLVLAAFVGIVEDSPPVARAAAMSGIVLFARTLFRRVDLLNTIALVAVALLIWKPASLFDPSFQLSFLAAAMIGALAMPAVEGSSGPYHRALFHLSDVSRDVSLAPKACQFRLDLRSMSVWLSSMLPRRLAQHSSAIVVAPIWLTLSIWEVFLVSAVIQLGMLPLMANYFHRVSLSGFLANIPAAVLSSLIVPIGFLAISIASISTTLASLLAAPLGWLVHFLIYSVAWCGQFRNGDYRIPNPGFWLLFPFFTALFILTAFVRVRLTQPWRFAATATLLAIATTIATLPFSHHFQRGSLQVTVLDVGQGDSIFVVLPNNRTILVDGGGLFGRSLVRGYRTGIDTGEQVVSPYLWSLGLKKIDVVGLTHAHLDHMDGLNALLDNFRVGELWVGHDINSLAFQSLLTHAAARGTRIVHHQRGDTLQEGSAIIRMLWPEDSSALEKVSNNDSLALRLEFGDSSVLLTGDIERPVEERLVELRENLHATFLKIGHHGSKTSTTDEFLLAVAPRLAAISVGENNPFGHPHPSVVERLETAHIPIFLTSRDGAITFTTDGKSSRLTTFAGKND